MFGNDIPPPSQLSREYASIGVESLAGCPPLVLVCSLGGWIGVVVGRIRTIKPEWVEDEKMLLASPAARVWSVALILLADDHGRGVGNPDLLVTRIFPGHSRAGKEGLAELSRMGYFTLYRCRGQTFYEITNWSKHQRVDRPGKPRVPPPSEADENLPESLANFRGTLATDRDHDRDHDHDQPEREFDFEAIYRSYPRKAGKKDGLAKLKAKVKEKADYDLLVQVVSRMAQAWQGHDLKYCPQFSTFVNQERWRDDQPPMPSDKPAVVPSLFTDDSPPQWED